MLQSLVVDLGDLVPPNSTLQERIDSDLVRRTQPRRRSTTLPSGCVGEREATEDGRIGLLLHDLAASDSTGSVYLPSGYRSWRGVFGRLDADPPSQQEEG